MATKDDTADKASHKDASDLFEALATRAVAFHKRPGAAPLFELRGGVKAADALEFANLMLHAVKGRLEESAPLNANDVFALHFLVDAALAAQEASGVTP